MIGPFHCQCQCQCQCHVHDLVVALPVLLLFLSPHRVICGSTDGAIARGAAVECFMEESDVTYLYFDLVSRGWRRPHRALATGIYASLSDDDDDDDDDDSSTLKVKECWCARLLGRPGDFCLPEFEKCFVPGKQGTVICSTTTTQTNIARGVWPFCLFIFVAMMYLWVASEMGRRARAFLSRHWGNGVARVQEKRQLSQPSRQANGQDQHQHQHQHQDEETGTSITDGPAIVENQISPTNDSLTTRQQPPPGPPALPVQQQQQQQQPLDRSDESSDSASHETLLYPVELGSRSNYLHLSNELHQMSRYDAERLARLFQSAWHRERRGTLRAARRQRLRNLTSTWMAVLNHPSRDEVEDHGDPSTTIPSDDIRHAASPPVRPWWDTRRTIKMKLKTKIFQCSEVVFVSAAQTETNRHEESGDTAVSEDQGDTQSENENENGDFHRNSATNHSPGNTESRLESSRNQDEQEGGQGNNTCAICLSELEDGELVGDIPCGHNFHKDCLKSWLTRSNRCPLCQQTDIASFEILP